MTIGKAMLWGLIVSFALGGIAFVFTFAFGSFLPFESSSVISVALGFGFSYGTLKSLEFL